MSLLPFQSHYFELGKLKLHYVDEGQGNPVVMLHGNPTWSFYYRNLAEELRSSHRVIVPDHIGCGYSDKPADTDYDYTLSRRVSDLERLLDHLGVTRDITLVVHDWGGMIGMAYATKYPDRIKRLVVLNTGAFHLPATKKLPLSLWLCRNTQLGAILVRRFNAFSGIASFVGCKRHPLSSKLRKAYRAPYNSWKNRIATLRFVQDIPLLPEDRGYDLITQTQDKLHLLSHLPMLICWGEKDFVFDRHFLAEWKHRFPEAEVHAFSDAGHYILEDAAEDVLPLISRFLQNNPIDGE